MPRNTIRVIHFTSDNTVMIDVPNAESGNLPGSTIRVIQFTFDHTVMIVVPNRRQEEHVREYDTCHPLHIWWHNDDWCSKAQTVGTCRGIRHVSSSSRLIIPWWLLFQGADRCDGLSRNWATRFHSTSPSLQGNLPARTISSPTKRILSFFEALRAWKFRIILFPAEPACSSHSSLAGGSIPG